MKFLRSFFIFFTALLCAVFCACSANQPNIRSVRCTVLLSYSSRISYPTLSLSVFAIATSPYDRVKSLKVEHRETSLEWTIDKPAFIGNAKNVWFGSSRLIVPSHYDLPKGDFWVSLIDEGMEKSTSKISVDYPEKLLAMSLAEAEETDEFLRLTAETLVIYAANDEILYVGPQILDFSTDEQILGYYPNAAYYTLVKTEEKTPYAVAMPPTILNEQLHFEEAGGERNFEKNGGAENVENDAENDVGQDDNSQNADGGDAENGENGQGAENGESDQEAENAENDSAGTDDIGVALES